MLLTLTNFFMLSFHFLLDQMNLVLWLNLSFTLVSIGLLGSFYNSQNLLIMLLCIELVLISIGLNFMFLSLLMKKSGQIFMLYMITMGAGESSIGLGLLVVLYSLKNNMSMEKFMVLS